MAFVDGIDGGSRMRQLLASRARGPRISAVVSLWTCAALATTLWLSCSRPSDATPAEGTHAPRFLALTACLAGSPRLLPDEYDRDLALHAQDEVNEANYEDAARLATCMQEHGSLEGDRERLLGTSALLLGHDEDALRHANSAFQAHLRAEAWRKLPSAALLLASAALKRGLLDDASTAADLARCAAWFGDRRTQLYAELARADVFRRVGAWDRVGEALDAASAIEGSGCDRAWALQKRGLYESESREDPTAAHDTFERAAEAISACEAAGTTAPEKLVLSVKINQANLQRDTDPDAARRILDGLAAKDQRRYEILKLRAHLAAGRGEIDDAERYLTAADEIPPPDEDYAWENALLWGELAEQRGGPDGDRNAERHYRRAIELIEPVRRGARSGAATVLSSHRAPYERLFSLLARQQRWREALAVVLSLDASDVLRPHGSDPDAPPGGGGPPSWHQLDAKLDAVIRAWQGRPLVIVVAPATRKLPGRAHHVYRLQLVDGRVAGEDIGDAAEVATWADEMFKYPGHPDHRAVARSLGHVLVPASAVAGDMLDVLAIGTVSKAPLAALRDQEGDLIIARRPLARVLSIQPRPPPPPASRPAVVIADPTGELIGARLEGLHVAARLGANTRRAGAMSDHPATIDELAAAGGASLLHFAGHIDPKGPGRALRLADGDDTYHVTARDIVDRRIAVGLAMLAGCASATAQDPEGWASLAAGFLEAGTPVVIATDRTILDGTSALVSDAFYRQPDWRTDPVRALADAQVWLAENAPTSAWAAFTALRRPPPPAPPE